MKNIVLNLEFDGTNYHGWQIQKNAVTVQEALQCAVKKVLKEDTKIIGCSRTDTGVHAINYVCNFKSQSHIPINRLPYALNSILPNDIVIKNSYEINSDFHARYSAKGKKYRYNILNGKFPSAIKRNYAYYWPYKLDINLMKCACKYFIGKHNFMAFMASGSEVSNTIRDIFDLTVEERSDEIIVEISANGFLYNMVRIIVGTLLYVGSKKIDVKEIPYIIEKADRKNAGITVQPQGLFLVEVYY